MCASPAWVGFAQSRDSNQIKGFIKKNYRIGQLIAKQASTRVTNGEIN